MTDKTYLFTTWNNLRADTIQLYLGIDGKIYGKRYGLPLSEYTEDWAMYLAWNHINRTTGWPVVWDPKENINKVTASQEQMDAECKRILMLK